MPPRKRPPLGDCTELPLFPLKAAGAKAAGTGAKTGEAATRAARPLGHAHCPRCHKERAAVVLSGTHALWREHVFTTWGGCPITCGASGVALCVLPAPAEPGAAPLGCPH